MPMVRLMSVASVTQRWRRSAGLVAPALAVVAVVAVSACANDDDAGPQETLGRIPASTGGPTFATTSTAPAPSPATTRPPITIATTAPAPSPVTTRPPNTIATTAPAPSPTIAPAPSPSTAAAPSPTSVVVTPTLDPPNCSAAAITADTGTEIFGEAVCHDGWALASTFPCESNPDACEALAVFHIAPDGWASDGAYYAVCAEGLLESGMTIVTAEKFTDQCTGDEQPDRSVIRPGSTGRRVMALQVALIAQGYRIEPDGRFGPRTEASVRNFQAARGLEVDGLAGPDTQAALGI